MSIVEIGAVEVTLYIRVYMYVDPYFPRLSLSTFELSEHQRCTGSTVLTGVNETILCVYRYHETV